MNFILQQVLLWIAAVFYGIMVTGGLIYNIFKKGYKKVLNWDLITRPSCLDDPSLGTHGYLHLEDVRVHYVASGPEDKPLMLFLHGFPEFWYSWRHQLKEFQKDYRVVAFDMRGYGESDKPSGIESYAMAKLTSDVKQVILALGYKSCVLVAHDWGGAVGWTFGRHYPEFVDKLIIMNAPPQPVMKKLFQSDSKQRKMSWYMFFFQLPFLPEFFCKLENFGMLDMIFRESGMGDEDISAYKHTFGQSGAFTPPLNYYRAALRLKSASYDMDYQMPVLLIWGCKDTALSLRIPEEVEKANPKIEVKRIENAQHFVQNHEPEAVNKAMREWLEKK